MWTSVSRIGCSTIIACALALGGCGSEEPEDPEPCTPPDGVVYGCEELPADSTGCSGSPEVFGSPPVPDPEAAFPVGCQMQLPFCHPYYPSGVATCTCMEQSGALDWVCPL